MSENMICPACEKFQPKAEECAHCGVIIAKAQKAAEPPPAPVKVEEENSGPPVALIGIVAVVVIAGGAFLFSGDDQSTGEQAAKKELSDIEKVAAVKPKVASQIQITQTKSKLQTLKTKLYMLSMEWPEPPTNEQGLNYLVNQGHLKRSEIKDAWGREFAYNMKWTNENAFMREYEITVHSLGADGLTNTADDIGMP